MWLGSPECSATWEPSSCIPKNLIDEYEAGLRTEAQVNTTTNYSHISGLITIAKTDSTFPPETKKPKQVRSSHESLEGYAC